LLKKCVIARPDPKILTIILMLALDYSKERRVLIPLVNIFLISSKKEEDHG